MRPRDSVNQCRLHKTKKHTFLFVGIPGLAISIAGMPGIRPQEFWTYLKNLHCRLTSPCVSSSSALVSSQPLPQPTQFADKCKFQKSLAPSLSPPTLDPFALSDSLLPTNTLLAREGGRESESARARDRERERERDSRLPLLVSTGDAPLYSVSKHAHHSSSSFPLPPPPPLFLLQFLQ